MPREVIKGDGLPKPLTGMSGYAQRTYGSRWQLRSRIPGGAPASWAGVPSAGQQS